MNKAVVVSSFLGKKKVRGDFLYNTLTAEHWSRLSMWNTILLAISNADFQSRTNSENKNISERKRLCLIFVWCQSEGIED